MDSSIWSIWHDLDASDEDEHIAWLHGVYLPSLKKLSGVLWVAHYRNVGGGPAMDLLHERLQAYHHGWRSICAQFFQTKHH